MPFENIQAPARNQSVPQIKLSARENKQGVAIRLSVPASILAAIGTPTDRYRIEVGCGADAGWLRLVKDKGGDFRPSLLKTAAVFFLGETAFSPDGRQGGTPVVGIADGAAALKIKLPSWAFLDELKAASGQGGAA